MVNRVSPSKPSAAHAPGSIETSAEKSSTTKKTESFASTFCSELLHKFSQIGRCLSRFFSKRTVKPGGQLDSTTKKTEGIFSRIIFRLFGAPVTSKPTAAAEAIPNAPIDAPIGCFCENTPKTLRFSSLEFLIGSDGSEGIENILSNGTDEDKSRYILGLLSLSLEKRLKLLSNVNLSKENEYIRTDVYKQNHRDDLIESVFQDVKDVLRKDINRAGDNFEFIDAQGERVALPVDRSSQNIEVYIEVYIEDNFRKTVDHLKTEKGLDEFKAKIMAIQIFRCWSQSGALIASDRISRQTGLNFNLNSNSSTLDIRNMTVVQVVNQGKSFKMFEDGYIDDSSMANDWEATFMYNILGEKLEIIASSKTLEMKIKINEPEDPVT